MKTQLNEKTNSVPKGMGTLPPGYTQQAVVDPSQSPRAVVIAILVGVVLLVTSGWLLAHLTNILRPETIAYIRFGDILTTTPTGYTLDIPSVLLRDVVIALILVLIIHELAHGLFYWSLSGRRPRFGRHGPFLYAAAPRGVFFPRNSFLIVGIAPLLCLTPLGVPLILIAPAPLVPGLLFFVTFNAAGSAADILTTIWLLSFSADAIMEDKDTAVVVYGPAKQRAAGRVPSPPDARRSWSEDRH